MTEFPSPESRALEAALGGRYVLERELGRGGMGVEGLTDNLEALQRLGERLDAETELRKNEAGGPD